VRRYTNNKPPSFPSTLFAFLSFFVFIFKNIFLLALFYNNALSLFCFIVILVLKIFFAVLFLNSCFLFRFYNLFYALCFLWL